MKSRLFSRQILYKSGSERVLSTAWTRHSQVCPSYKTRSSSQNQLPPSHRAFLPHNRQETAPGPPAPAHFILCHAPSTDTVHSTSTTDVNWHSRHGAICPSHLQWRKGRTDQTPNTRGSLVRIMWYINNNESCIL